MLVGFQRLRRAEDIRRVLHNGHRIGTRFFQAVVLPTSTGQPARATTIVSRKVHHLAVKRQRAKRQLRSILKDLLIKYPEGYDMVIVARATIVGATAADLQVESGMIDRRLTSLSSQT